MLSLNGMRPFGVNSIIKLYRFGSKQTISYYLEWGVTKSVNHLLYCVVPGVLRDVICASMSFVVSMEGKE